MKLLPRVFVCVLRLILNPISTPRGSHIDLVYVICLPFGVLFHEIWYSNRWVFIRDEGAQIQKLGVF